MERDAIHKTPSVDGLIRSARAKLIRAQKLLNEEIAAYPPPIAGCDAQFNHMLAERRRLRIVLRVMDEEIPAATSRDP